ncbi:MAG: cell division protein FtsZ, partial [Candidatus Levybacteria bacterium CG10_big_fil_rev_8_21_14_0_10_36_7]
DISIDGSRGVLFAISGGEDLTMFEIQDAANVITESIDPDAKVIFGAIQDERLKKNQIKVTVIASNFPEGKFTKKPSIFQSISGGTTPAEKGGDNSQVKEKNNEENFSPAKEKENEEKDDSWDAIPAFLRRKKVD